MRVRPGKTRSLIGGVLMLVVMIVGLLMMPGDMGIGGPMGGAIGIFKIVWVAFGLIGAAASFYNALSKEGVPLYEVEMEEEREYGSDAYCPECGKAVRDDDKFCRHCGASLQ